MASTNSEKMDGFTTAISLTNEVDNILAEQGIIPANQVRSIILNNALITPNARRLSLPADAIDRLGLTLQEEIEVKTEAGVKKVRIFKDAILEIKGRKIWYNCLELQAGENAVVGTLPLFALGLEIDWQSQQIKMLTTEAYMRM
ncbi:aspartyl protease [Kamptonema animale CS-326]|uniref:aspartyl protease n=1 Tax=Kamptonema animale TaxID=92934 RepID=UPI00232CA90B|nr:aspartyl protease [Kamptonema animale]MDB9509964.1 aspartyl protease [Kamptonema animale CS-326]